MAKEADVNEKLWRAVGKGNEDTVRLLLKERGNPNYRSTYKEWFGDFEVGFPLEEYCSIYTYI